MIFSSRTPTSVSFLRKIDKEKTIAWAKPEYVIRLKKKRDRHALIYYENPSTF
jgi:hypothetical protein